MCPLAEGGRTETRTLRLDTGLYPMAAVNAARQAFAAQCSVTERGRGEFVVQPTAKASPMVVEEFLNEVLRQAVRLYLEAQAPTLVAARIVGPAL